MDSAKRSVRLCMLSGSFEYDSERSLGWFAEHLKRSGGIETELIAFRDEDDTPSLAPIEVADVVLVFTRRLRLRGPELERFQAYCAAGRPLVAVRTASHGFQNWLAFDQEVLGGNYQGHYGTGPYTLVRIEPEGLRHPIFRNVLSFESEGSLYKNTPLREDAILLATGHTPEASEPVAWTRLHRGGRIFTTSLGVPSDFQSPHFLRMLENAVRWAAGEE